MNKRTVADEHGQIGLTDSTDATLFTPTSHPDAQWFPEAGLGMFLHWGISSVRGMGISWPMIPGRALFHNGRIADPAERDRIVREKDFNLTGEPPAITPLEYWEMAKDFDPQQYDPDKWCAAFKKAGFAYVVLTTKHHDGFAMWPSDQGDFNTKNWMNGRDLIKTFVEACRRHELKVGLYFSGQDWYHDRDYRNFLYWQVEKVNPEFPTIRPDLEPHDHPQRTAEQMADCTDIFPHKPLHWTAQQIKERDERYRCFVRGQLEELLTRFGKIDLLWFDSAPPIPERETSIITMDRIRELQPGIVINPRFFKGGDFKSYERTPPTDPLTAPWNEFCDVWTNTWTHTTNEVYKSTAWIVSLLVACRARGMNYLLGIGPNRDGELVPEAYTHIGELGRWLAVHRAAVLNGATQLPDNESANVPATASGSNRFLFALRQFDGDERTKDALLPHEDTDLTLTGATEPAAVTLMADGEPLEWSSDNGTVTVDLPAERRTELGDVVRMNL